MPQAPAARMDRDLAVVDPEIARWIEAEGRRQNEGLELIASENWVSRAVREAQGSVLTNKYAEGYPGKRYYGGCEFVDKVEQLAIDRAKALFRADHANVQPHSGSQANMSVYLTALKSGDTIAVRETSKTNPTILHAQEEVKGRGIPEWISPEGELGTKIVSMPTREQINLPVQEQLIVELYSK